MIYVMHKKIISVYDVIHTVVQIMQFNIEIRARTYQNIDDTLILVEIPICIEYSKYINYLP